MCNMLLWLLLGLGFYETKKKLKYDLINLKKALVF